LTTPFALLLFGGGRGAGLAPQRLTPCGHPAEPVLPYNGADGNGARTMFLLPVFGGEMTRQKSGLSRV